MTVLKIFLVLLLTFSFPLFSVEIFKKDDSSLNLGFKGITWFQSIEDLSPDKENWSKDFSLRQFRLYGNGKINKLISFAANLDFSNLGKIDGEEKNSISTSLTDFFINFSFNEKFQIITGKYRAPFSRVSLTDTYTGWAFVHGYFSFPASFLSQSNDYRQKGLLFWGNLEKFRYNIGVSSDIPKEIKDKGGDITGSGSFQYTGRIDFTAVGKYKSYVYTNQWLGKKEKYINFGIGYTTLKYQYPIEDSYKNFDYKAMVVDTYGEFPISSGYLIFESGYFFFDKDIPMNPKTKTFFIKTGYFIKNYQPIFKIENLRRDGNENDSKVLAIGFNYYIKEHDAKIMFEFLSIKNEANARLFLLGDEEAGKDKKALTVAFQITI